MKFKLGYLFLFLSCSLNVTFADNPYLSEIKEGVPACLTVEKYYELLQAIGNQDKNQMDYLFSNGCILTKPGIKISPQQDHLVKPSEWQKYACTAVRPEWSYGRPTILSQNRSRVTLYVTSLFTFCNG